MYHRLRAFLLPVVAFTLFAAGCAKQYLPNTDVEDTDDNRRAVMFCEKYRKAVERRDAAGILAMVSPKYYEDGGNVDASDDLDFDGLKEYLSQQFADSKAIRYEIRYRRIIWKPEVRQAFVDYTYSASFKIPGPEGKDEWRRLISENRLVLSVEGEDFKILAGL